MRLRPVECIICNRAALYYVQGTVAADNGPLFLKQAVFHLFSRPHTSYPDALVLKWLCSWSLLNTNIYLR